MCDPVVVQVMAAHSAVEVIGAHPNILIAMYAIDSLKQLGVKFLERTELSHFQFQQVFMQPFERIMIKNPNLEIRELVLSVINNIIQLRHANIMSGWKVIFSVYSAAASDRRNTHKAAFDAMTGLIDTHWELVHPILLTSSMFCQLRKEYLSREYLFWRYQAILSRTGRLVEGNVDVHAMSMSLLTDSPKTKDT